MSALPFTKYQGAGNDFVLVDDRARRWSHLEAREPIAAVCARHTGIGADGLIFLRMEAGPRADRLRMVYYNADGAPSSFCGNGSRCFLAFAAKLGLIAPSASVTFEANDGTHTGQVHANDRVSVSMRVVGSVQRLTETDDHVQTGSPHFVRWVDRLPDGDIVPAARAVRYSPEYAARGVNVNLVAIQGPRSLTLRTYERGVENETLACGTGVTAAALSFAERQGLTGALRIAVAARGGMLAVSLERSPAGEVQGVILQGPAVEVFSGEYPAI